VSFDEAPVLVKRAINITEGVRRIRETLRGLAGFGSVVAISVPITATVVVARQPEIQPNLIFVANSKPVGVFASEPFTLTHLRNSYMIVHNYYRL
jgi:hypothetical protein